MKSNRAQRKNTIINGSWSLYPGILFRKVMMKPSYIIINPKKINAKPSKGLVPRKAENVSITVAIRPINLVIMVPI